LLRWAGGSAPEARVLRWWPRVAAQLELAELGHAAVLQALAAHHRFAKKLM